MDCSDKTKCMRRSLVQVANLVFKDPRKAKKWLTTANDMLDGQTPLNAVKDQLFTSKEITTALRADTKGL